LLIDAKFHRLDVAFCDPFPHVNKKPNILFTIMQHMESTANQALTSELIAIFESGHPPPPSLQRPSLSAAPSEGLGLPLWQIGSTERLLGSQETVLDMSDSLRMLRLLSPSLFSPDQYRSGSHVANGAFGSVMTVNKDGKRLAVKSLRKARNEFDNPHLFEVFTEVSILSICQNDRRVTQLYDYGCTSDTYYIVMEYYPMTLKSWRAQNPDASLEVLLRLYREFLEAVTVLRDRKINHFDIKCDNVMLDGELHPCLGDFGESMLYTNESDAVTMLNKGTEWIKSPEMLSIALNSTVTNPKFDRRRTVGAGPANDIWSVGCLFYELLAGEYLFTDSNWSRFFMRITEKSEPLILEENRKRMPDEPRFCQFLEFVLQRRVRSRPSLEQVIAKFDEMFPEGRPPPDPP
jgi:serine/threonine protein kinase